MTEPGVASSDPLNLQTTARPRRRHEWVIDGHKWFTTGADGAEFAVVVARTGPPPEHGTGRIQPHHRALPTRRGGTIVRDPRSIGAHFIGGHPEIRSTRPASRSSNLLGDEGAGFVATQKRLASGPPGPCHALDRDLAERTRSRPRSECWRGARSARSSPTIRGSSLPRRLGDGPVCRRA